MKRSEFLKKFGLGLAAIAIAPKVISEIKPNNTIIWDEEAIMPKHFDSIGMLIPKRRRAGKAAISWANQTYTKQPLYFVRFDEYGNTVEIKRISG